MKFWTDYPFESLGDAPYKKAPVRQIDVLSYDNDKYCKIKVEGVHEEIKAGYIYQKEGRFGKVPVISQNQLKQLSIEFELERETMQIENYDPNSNFGTHTVKLVFKMWEYEYSALVRVKGNCKGFTILKSAFDNFIFDFKFEGGNDWTTLMFKDAKGDELEVTLSEEDFETELEDYLISATIIEFEKD